ncbi:hypothetical protein [Delftia phage PhiW-14]|uniref:Uncharacterized protein n=1 Tax=Delftia phage PhiW-14 TaxID=665032 RepID=C9DGE3_BPW14|nr:hypothetical protein DP-phiW-14_gp173 [Delftia phage PhiW-14]ACV50194.1 hypothetical protein [Delftia phage PhiW-14]
MNDKFNPFREALTYLYTLPGHDRGGVPRHKGPRMFICQCLERVEDNQRSIVSPEFHLKAQQSKAAVRHVQRMLGRSCLVVENWLSINVPGFKAQRRKDGKAMAYDVQAYRWRWLNHMADQYDKGEIEL